MRKADGRVDVERFEASSRLEESEVEEERGDDSVDDEKGYDRWVSLESSSGVEDGEEKNGGEEQGEELGKRERGRGGRKRMFSFETVSR